MTNNATPSEPEQTPTRSRSRDLDLTDPSTWPQMMTPTEVAQVMRVHYRTVMKQISEAKIPAHRIGTGYRISRQWLLDHIGTD